MADYGNKLRILTTVLCISYLIASGVDFRDAPWNVTKGKTLKIECGSGSVFPTQWVFNNGITNRTLQEQGNPRVIRVSNKSLQLLIADADYDHNGQYVCQEVRNHTDKIIFMQLKIVVTNRTTPYCGDHMFECLGRCIARRFLCDKIVDCKDESDEKDCPVLCDFDTHFLCVSGQCINASLRCDKFHSKDCRDGSDELGCPDRIYKHTGQIQSPDENDPSQTMLYRKQGWHSHGIYGIVVAVMGLVFTITVIVVTICRIHMRRDAQMAMIGPRARTPTLSTNSESREETYHPSTSGAVFVETGPATVPGELKGLIVSPPPYSTIDRTDTPPPPYENIDDTPHQHSTPEEEQFINNTSPSQTASPQEPRTDSTGDHIHVRPSHGDLHHVHIGPL